MTHIPVQQIAKLSSLSLSDAELERFGTQLDQTVEYIENLQELDVEKVEPTSSPAGKVNMYFEDGTKNERALPPAAYKVSRIL
jgi:aspartyl/glutamyl-tRNA(Asn/Gln) amidotransferase C subunit